MHPERQQDDLGKTIDTWALMVLIMLMSGWSPLRAKLLRWLYPELRLVPKQKVDGVLHRAHVRTFRNWQWWVVMIAALAAPFVAGGLALWLLKDAQALPTRYRVNAVGFSFGAVVLGSLFVEFWTDRRLTRAAITTELAEVMLRAEESVDPAESDLEK